jgi:1-aminocyclopropane-1-carboxylate deaminase/D-cysteine desulfhydrase-like pyridoxal-dependent ACC family enzyme
MTGPAVLGLGRYPTPVERASVSVFGTDLWVKRDDRSAELYGGNKVRKLERLLGAARAAGKRHLVTIGAAGSHQIVATALFGAREGFTVDAVLVPQPESAHGRQNLRVALGAGLRPVVAPSWALVPPLVAARLALFGRSASLVPLGGSNLVGSLGFVDAARELAAQIAAGELPEPDVVVVAMGSGGTAGGLAAGFEAAGLRTRVVGVAVATPVAIVRALGLRLATQCARAAGLSPVRAAAARARLTVDRGWLGRGYGYATSEGEVAIRRAAAAGLKLDVTYTAKAFACALDRARTGARRGERVLYWHTLSSVDLGERLADAPNLPPDLAALFR